MSELGVADLPAFFVETVSARKILKDHVSQVKTCFFCFLEGCPSVGTMTSVPVRWGIIGCGDVTEVKSGPAFQLATGSQLVAVMRRDAEKARDYAERHSVPRWYSTVEGLLSDQEIDAIYIATPPGSRVEIAEQVAKSGKPCYLEKPMARNFTESQLIAQVFESNSVPLFVAYYRRCYPRFVRLKALLASGQFGRISSVQYRLERPAASSTGWRQDVSTSGGGLFVDLGSHVLALFVKPFTFSIKKIAKGTQWRQPPTSQRWPPP